MKHFLIFVLLTTTIIANAQPFSQSLSKGTALDTAKYKVTYHLQYKNHPEDKHYMEDTRILQIGRNIVKDYSEILFHFDSLRTAEECRGANAYSNPTGNPWALEILNHVRSKCADVKYRLPLMSGTLHYQDSLPSLSWQFVPERCDTILGYECQQATAGFAGRTYTAWFTTELPLPFGPYKFGGLPGLILKIQDNERQYLWEAVGIERSALPIMMYSYDNEKRCSATDAVKTIGRYFKTPYAFLSAGMGGARIMVKGTDGRFHSSTEVEDTSIPYKPIEIK